ncbi:nuclear transport factor 2 family protein [Natronorubrum texcoconense]|uniref:SnoaL-like domain-containing protein n=1 Tax=Natronorubrum texcoconense TaxID=1095776 RepID=A0A1G9D2U0_9EURY|nr:nuclear transport factor 2 family protein [Natronorubrum texcoconense]SDK58004.1 SnoaL-like domain-containing protein [Natronorubrum texcoconense]
MTQTPRAVVEEFFDRMADADERATVDELFTSDAVITLPGARFDGGNAATAMLEWLEGRYEWADKEFDDWIESGARVVSQGTLYGVDSDGNRFDDVRYVDIYRVEDGQITRVDIYNDLAAAGVVQ